MRVGDFSVEVVAAGGVAIEVQSGHVLARPGQVYTLRLRNHGPLRAVVDVSIDGRRVTGGGLVLNASSAVDLERPIHATERGRFTVIAEGNERVFGPDGGRDNPDLGLIEARFRRELPDERRFTRELPDFDRMPVTEPTNGRPWPHVTAPRSPSPSRRWVDNRLRGSDALDGESAPANRPPMLSALMAGTPIPASPDTEPATPMQQPDIVPLIGDPRDAIERAAGTGLTGSSQQEFVSVHVGRLETEATVITLRLVIGTHEALSAPRPLPDTAPAPARPAARP
jgi:hypothetical protein